MIEKNPFKEGYEFFEKNNGILVGTYCGAKYIHSVEDAIKKFQDDLINRAGHPHQKHSAIEFLTSIVFKD